MALYMLSTDIATCLILGKSKTLDARVASVSPEELCISAVTRGELLLGVSRQMLQETAVGPVTAERRKRTYIPQGKGREAEKKGGEAEPSSTHESTPTDESALEALRKIGHSALAALTPEEAKALRARFGIDMSSQIDLRPEITLESIDKRFDEMRERLRPKAAADNLSGVVDQFLTRVSCLPWDAAAATRFATVAFELHRIGAPMGTADTMVVGHAIAVGAVLVTSSDQRVLSVGGLKMENWTRRRPTQ
jgi:predicted nucleic acid-binding protein